MDPNSKNKITSAGVIALSWPIFLENALQMSMGFIDVLMLSFISDEAVAGIGIANQAILMTIMIINFVTVGSSVVITHYLGGVQRTQANIVASTSITMAAILGVLLGLVFLSSTDIYLKIFSLESETYQYAEQYLLIVGTLIIFYALNVAGSSILRANGYTKSSLYITIGIAFLNIVGNYLFIFGALGMPQLGVVGVAYATVGSRLVGSLVMIVMIFRIKLASLSLTDYLILKVKYIKKILNIGIPGSLEQIFFQISQLIILSIVTILGSVSLNVHIYTNNILMFVILFNLSIAQGTQIIIGHFIGEKNIEKANMQFYKSLKIGTILLVLILLVLFIFRNDIYYIFTEDQSLIRLGASIIILSLFLEPARALNTLLVHSLRAVKDVKFPAILSIISTWILCIPLAYLFSITLNMGLIGVWLAFCVDEWLRGIILLLRWVKKSWVVKSSS